MKLETFVDFPTRNLDLNSYLASISPLCGEVNDHFVKDQLSANYNLLGVAVPDTPILKTGTQFMTATLNLKR